MPVFSSALMASVLGAWSGSSHKTIVLCSRHTDVTGISNGTNVASNYRLRARTIDMASIAIFVIVLWQGLG